MCEPISNYANSYITIVPLAIKSGAKAMLLLNQGQRPKET